MYVYLVVLMINGMYSVQAPNIIFPDLETCEIAKELNSLVLKDSTPTSTAKFYAQCVKIPYDVDV
jgi:hypothetical protein